jgi:hypothetical protein
MTTTACVLRRLCYNAGKMLLQHTGPQQPGNVSYYQLSCDYWAAQIAEARARMVRALSSESSGHGDGEVSPAYIKDPQLLLEYWAARTAEHRARVGENLALASLNVNMDIALQESSEMLRQLEEAMGGAPRAMDSLMNGRLW